MNDFYEKPAIRIRELRELRRYSREKLAELADVSPKFLYEIETRKKGFTADTLYRIANALSVSCEYILTGADQSYTNELKEALQLFNSKQNGELVKILRLVYEMMLNNKSSE